MFQLLLQVLLPLTDCVPGVVAGFPGQLGPHGAEEHVDAPAGDDVVVDTGEDDVDGHANTQT